MKLLESEAMQRNLTTVTKTQKKKVIKKCPLLVGSAGWDNKTWKIGVDLHRPSQIDFKLQVEALLIGKCLSIPESLAILI